MFYLRTLGGLSLARPDAEGADALANSKALLVLAVLATRPDRSARRDYVASLLWPDADRPRALRALRQALFYLSRQVGAVLLKEEDTLALDKEQFNADLWEFDEALNRGAYARVIELYRGPFAAGLERKVGTEAEHWIEAENSRILVGVEVAYTREIARAEGNGDSGRAVALARAYADLNPLNERAQHALVHALQNAGDEVGALRAFEAYRRLAERELGEDPPAEMAARMAQVREELLVPIAEPVAAGPVREPSTPDRPAATVRARSISRRAVVFALAGAALAAIALALATSGRTALAGSLEQLNGRVLATADTGGREAVMEVTLRGKSVEVRPVPDLAPSTLPSPDGRSRAVLEQAANGWNVAIRTADPGQVRTVTTEEGDEYPLAWSPDGRYLVYAHRRLMGDGRTQQHRILVHDLVADTGWRLTPLESSEVPDAAWSPDGTRIAYTADVLGAPEVFVVDFDGANLQRVSRHRAADVDPAWSPDGERLAFVSRRGNAVDLYTVRPDATDLRRVTQTVAEESTPAWVSPSAVVFVAKSDDETDLWAVDTFTGETRRLTRRGGLTALIALQDQGPRWLDGVRIAPRPELGSPGQYLRLSVEVTERGGDPLVGRAVPIRWRTRDSSLVAIGESGWIRLLQPGRAVLVATAAGWRADTLSLLSVPLTAAHTALVFSEDWAHGVRSDRWRIFGDPVPYARAGVGPEGAGIFVNHGDEFFASGAVTRQSFPIDRGLTVEVEGQIAFTGKHHQEFGIALYDTEHVDSVLATGEAPSLVEFRVRGHAGDQVAQASLATPRRRTTLPLLDRLRTWRTYALQIHPDGRVELIVDGRLFWQSPEPLDNLNGAVYVGLGFQSFETEVAHGPVRVYVPVRHTLPQTTMGPVGGR